MTSRGWVQKSSVPKEALMVCARSVESFTDKEIMCKWARGGPVSWEEAQLTEMMRHTRGEGGWMPRGLEIRSLADGASGVAGWQGG